MGKIEDYKAQREQYLQDAEDKYEEALKIKIQEFRRAHDAAQDEMGENDERLTEKELSNILRITGFMPH